MTEIKLTRFAPSLEEYELNLDYYHGKDILHTGCLLKLDPEYSWERINSKIRNKIRKAQKLSIDIERVKGAPEDIEKFRTIWFDPEDETLPSELSQDEVMYFAYRGTVLVGGLILTPSSPKTLYMHNLGSNEEGKKNNIPGLLLWHAVEDLKDSAFDYIDVGVSFRPTLYNFFKNWQSDSYPIIFNPPFIKPDVRLMPFQTGDIVAYQKDTSKDAKKIVDDFFGDNYTILPRATHCIKALMQHLNVQKTDSVAVIKNFDNKYNACCVTSPIEDFCSVTQEIDETTKAVVVVHEFGFPYQDTKKVKAECEERGVPLIEDCAWSIGGYIDRETKMGEVGDYAIYSLPKVFPMQYGGIVKGLSISDDDNWQNYKMLDYFKREIIVQQLSEYLPRIDEFNTQRCTNYDRLDELFNREGFSVLKSTEDVYPGVFLVRLPDVEDVAERYRQFGVEAYTVGDLVALPVHGCLSGMEVDYIFGVFRGKLNLSSNYQRGGKK